MGTYQVRALDSLHLKPSVDDCYFQLIHLQDVVNVRTEKPHEKEFWLAVITETARNCHTLARKGQSK